MLYPVPTRCRNIPKSPAKMTKRSRLAGGESYCSSIGINNLSPSSCSRRKPDPTLMWNTFADVPPSPAWGDIDHQPRSHSGIHEKQPNEPDFAGQNILYLILYQLVMVSQTARRRPLASAPDPAVDRFAAGMFGGFGPSHRLGARIVAPGADPGTLARQCVEQGSKKPAAFFRTGRTEQPFDATPAPASGRDLGCAVS